jgi:hypothetical protein
VPTYLVESYLPRSEAGSLDDLAARARRAAEAMTRSGMPIRYLRCTFLPEDEYWLLLFDAHSLEAVDEAARQAEIPYERIIEAVDPAAAPERGLK